MGSSVRVIDPLAGFGTCSPKVAADACGINQSAARYHRKDLEFRTRWDKCIEILVAIRVGARTI